MHHPTDRTAHMMALLHQLWSTGWTKKLFNGSMRDRSDEALNYEQMLYHRAIDIALKIKIINAEILRQQPEHRTTYLTSIIKQNNIYDLNNSYIILSVFLKTISTCQIRLKKETALLTTKNISTRYSEISSKHLIFYEHLRNVCTR